MWGVRYEMAMTTVTTRRKVNTGEKGLEVTKKERKRKKVVGERGERWRGGV